MPLSETSLNLLRKNKGKSAKAISSGDLSSAEGLAGLMRKAGYTKEADEIMKPEKMGFLQRLGTGLSAFETGNALYQTKYEAKNFLETYAKDVFTDIKSAVTGRQSRTEVKKTYSDVLAKEGMTQRKGKLDVADILGFGMDNLLDPSEWVGGGVIGWAGKGLQSTGKKAFQFASKVDPKLAQAVSESAETLGDVLREKFTFAYKTSKGLGEDVLETTGRLKGIKEKALQKEIKIYSNLSTVEKSDLSETLFKAKQSAWKEGKDIVADRLGKLKDNGVRFGKNTDEVQSVLMPFYSKRAGKLKSIVENKANEKILGLQKNLELLASKEVKEGTADLSEIIKGLRKGLGKKSKSIIENVKNIDDDEELAKAIINGVVASKRDELKLIIQDLEQMDLLKKSVGEATEEVTKKSLRMTYNQKVIDLQTKIVGTVNNLNQNLSYLDDIQNASKLGKDKMANLKPMVLNERVALQKDKFYKDILPFKTANEMSIYENIIKPRTLHKADLADISDTFAQYYPSIQKDKMKGFLNSAYTLKVGQEGYKKQFRDLLKWDDLVQDPAVAFGTRNWEITRNAVIRKDLSEYVKTYGEDLTKFKTVDEARKAGYELLKEKGIYGKSLGYLKKWDKKFIDGMFGDSYRVVDELAKATGFDYVTGLFKRFVTGIFVPFHARNYVSGVMQNYEVLGKDVFRPDNIADGLSGTMRVLKDGDFSDMPKIKLGKKLYEAKTVWMPFKKRFAGSSSYIADVEQYMIDSTRGATGKMIRKLNPLSAENYVWKGAQQVGNFIETNQKAVAYMTALRQGKNFNESLELATKAGFDYRMLAPFESKVMKRLVPFYTYWRKNLGLQLDVIKKNPERIQQITKAFRDTINQDVDEENSTPDWMSNRFMMNLGKSKTGERQVIAGFGTPIEEFASKFSENPILAFLSQTNPLIKTPIELSIGKDFFSQRDIKDIYTASEYSSMPKLVKDVLKIKEVKKEIWKNNKPTGKYKIQYVADPTRLHIARSLFTSRLVNYIDTIFDDNELTGKAKAIKATTGLRPYVIDEETLNYFDDKKKKDALESVLRRLGIIKTFTKSYIPKK